MFGQFKTAKVKMEKMNGLKVDKLMMVSSNPLATGFLVREVTTDFPETVKELEVTIRATLSHRKSDCVDILFVVQSGGFLRISLAIFEFRVSSSFKTKCVHEDLGGSRLLVGIDIFDSKEPNIHPIAFNVKSLALLSETHSLSTTGVTLPMLQSNMLLSQKMIYFVVDLGKSEEGKKRERSDHKVCYKESNVSLIASEKNAFFEYLSRENLLGFFDQESKSIKYEFRTMIAKIKQKFDCQVSLACEEFLDFEILWSYQNIGLFGREAAIYSPENDAEIHGIHSILSTPLNIVSFRSKKTKPMSSPIFSVLISAPKIVKHDFAKER